MNTTYGEMNDEYWVNYFHDLVGRFYKLLPMREEMSKTLDLYIESLLRELAGNKELAVGIKHNSNFIGLCGVLQNLMSEKDINIYRSDIFKCISLIKKIESSIGGDLNGS